MTPYEYLCKHLLENPITAHIYDIFSTRYECDYSDVMDGLHDDIKNLIIGRRFDCNRVQYLDEAISDAIETYVKDGNLLLYDVDKASFLKEVLNVPEYFSYPDNIPNPQDFYDALMSSELYRMYRSYLKSKAQDFEYRVSYKGEDEGISNRYEIELKRW